MYQFMKRCFDLAASFIGLILLLPVFLILVLLVWMKLGRPALFTQLRPGLQGKPFRIYKFRTMTNEKDRFGKLLPDELRITGLGSFLRSCSLDELPALVNVLKGEMSLVGPRPLLMQYLDRYTDEQLRRHEVKPGITGWAQVNGRNALGWEEKFALDVWYVDHASLWLDMKVLLLTIVKVFKREGIIAEGTASMPEFMGTGNSRQYLHTAAENCEAAASGDRV